MLIQKVMRIVESQQPRPHLLASVEPDLLREPGKAPKTPVQASLPNAKPSVGRTGRIFLSVLGAALVVGLALFVINKYAGSSNRDDSRKLVPRATHSLVKPSAAPEPPSPITVQFNANMLQVTAISLGHPKLALINGKQVSEGDVIVLHVPNHSVAVSLKVLKISDGQIEVSDGTQVFAARLMKGSSH